jgi:AhpD family alkylhydroperoxidase
MAGDAASGTSPTADDAAPPALLRCGDRGDREMAERTMMEILAAECPAAAEAMRGFFATLMAQPALDEKTKQLVYVAAAAAAGHVRGVPPHAARAKAAGATRAEVVEALLLTVPAAGFGPLSRCLSAAIEVFEE